MTLSRLAWRCIGLHLVPAIIFAAFTGVYTTDFSLWEKHVLVGPNPYWLPSGPMALILIYSAFMVDSTRRLAFERYVWRTQILTATDDLASAWSNGFYSAFTTLFRKKKPTPSATAFAFTYFLCILTIQLTTASIFATSLSRSAGDVNTEDYQTVLGLSEYIPQIDQTSLSSLLDSSLLEPFMNSEKIEAPGLVNASLYDSLRVDSGILYARGDANMTTFNASCYLVPDTKTTYNTADKTWTIDVNLPNGHVELEPIIELAPNTLRSVLPRGGLTDQSLLAQFFVSTMEIVDGDDTSTSKASFDPPIIIRDAVGDVLTTYRALTIVGCSLDVFKAMQNLDLGELRQVFPGYSGESPDNRLWSNFNPPNPDYFASYPAAVKAAIRLWPYVFALSPPTEYPLVLNTTSAGSTTSKTFTRMDQQAPSLSCNLYFMTFLRRLILRLLRINPDYTFAEGNFNRNTIRLSTLDYAISVATAAVFYALSHKPLSDMELSFRNATGTFPQFDPALSRGETSLQLYEVFMSGSSSATLSLNFFALILNLSVSIVLLLQVLFLVLRHQPPQHAKTTMTLLQAMWLAVKQTSEVSRVIERVDDPTTANLRQAGLGGELRTRLWTVENRPSRKVNGGEDDGESVYELRA
ncbi:hypothetical protein DL96DRAFT_1593788 [Flagelloscypha sp. PMI_526]|nr:hypothetical protein DL96DRAFT_1593788 [Flagelloscypha sp. PMI_526]